MREREWGRERKLALPKVFHGFEEAKILLVSSSKVSAFCNFSQQLADI